ncbi:MAG TPA: biopolymer transporter ExbD [Verrucomicrobiae bacterium]|jgi:biopolymer transport protein ExbD
MKKCSRTTHNSLTELNITPLLDLAFVLLVIFIITTIPPVNDQELKLPTASKHLKEQPREATYISVSADGKMFLNQEPIASLEDLLQKLITRRMADADLSVIVRGDTTTKYKDIRSVLDICQQANVPKLDMATEPLNPLGK